MSLNKVMLIGNVGQDPEVRYLEPNNSSVKVATLRIATTERYRDRNGEVRENTEWHNIVAWRNLADIIERYVKKGSQLYIEGRLRTRSWDDQNGNKRYTTEVLADNIQLLGRRQDNPGAQSGNYQPTGVPGAQGSGYQPAGVPGAQGSGYQPAGVPGAQGSGYQPAGVPGVQGGAWQQSGQQQPQYQQNPAQQQPQYQQAPAQQQPQYQQPTQQPAPQPVQQPSQPQGPMEGTDDDLPF